ncbi:MAG: response regulator transcription factor [Flavobacteriales bacterium]|jgi:two-component system response regulator NreC|nr:response regulator transcription factor [Flavobacteriales bacterium]NCG29683.1 response regulator [Bacteroidota bacterium]MBT3964638.1 response regulator transcription factor [Flavobacteriales bacterium]MBT4704408.1 response regulator transcription factor [Flavobacteriales bacterium]MBT4929481.1 response regulator transcription factor [Flavobacteriales bacterium]
MIRLALADDHQLVLDGLKSLIKEVDDFEFVAEATDGKRLVDIVNSLTLDIALVDIDMPIMNGLQAIKEIAKQHDHVRCIARTMHNDPSMMRKVMASGAKGYLLKNIDQEDLVEAIRNVHSGGEVFSEELDTKLHREGQEMNVDYQNPILENQLTDREIEILKLIAQGFSNKEIGDRLFISHRTVDTHRTNLMKKLDVHNIAGLIRYAIRSGYVE